MRRPQLRLKNAKTTFRASLALHAFTIFGRMKKYHLATYGCQMNEYDSAMIAQELDMCGCVETNNQEDADIIIVNTCSVREKAEETAIVNISKLKYLRKKNPDVKVVVCGCMAKNRGPELLKRLKNVNYIVGPDQYRKIPELLFGDAQSPLHKTHHKMFIDEDRDENYLGEYAKLQNDVSAFVAIQRGCNKRCSYCIVPYLRGPEKYRDMDDVLTEVKRAADKGITEVMLLGQTVNAYKTPNADFTTLLTKVSEIGGIKRIRFTSPHPRHYTNELIDVLLNNHSAPERLRRHPQEDAPPAQHGTVHDSHRAVAQQGSVLRHFNRRDLRICRRN